MSGTPPALGASPDDADRDADLELGQAVNFALASNTFTDPQAQKLTYAATLSSGAHCVMAELQCDHRTFTGTVPNTAAGLTIKVTATDTSGLSASETFSVLTPALHPGWCRRPRRRLEARTGRELRPASNTFTDPQAEKLTTRHAVERRGVAVMAELQRHHRNLHRNGPQHGRRPDHQGHATDTAASRRRKPSRSDAATAPRMVSQTATQTWKLGQAVSFALPSNTSRPAGGEADLLRHAVERRGVASWLSFNATTEPSPERSPTRPSA